MSEWKVQMLEIGRGKVTKTIVIKASDLLDAEDAALRECHKFLASKIVELVHGRNTWYDVTAGFRSVGKVRITAHVPERGSR